MNPIKSEVLERKKGIILRELKILEEVQKKYNQGIRDEILEHAMCHAMQNAISAIIDISHHIVVERRGDAPESYSEAISALGDLGILKREFADSYSRVAKLRNVLVHLYDNIDIDFLFSLITPFRQDTKVFLTHIQGI